MDGWINNDMLIRYFSVTQTILLHCVEFLYFHWSVSSLEQKQAFVQAGAMFISVTVVVTNTKLLPTFA